MVVFFINVFASVSGYTEPFSRSARAFAKVKNKIAYFVNRTLKVNLLQLMSFYESIAQQISF